MNYYDARQRVEDRRWAFTCRNDDRIWAVGYCRDHEKEGHPTEQEARECYRQYLLDNVKYSNPENPSSMHKCHVCGTFTAGTAHVGDTQVFVLCNEHRNREELSKLVDLPGQIVSSY